MVLAEDHWLSVLQHKYSFISNRPLCEIFECAIVEDIAILIDLNKRSAFMMESFFESCRQVLCVDIDRAGNKGSFCSYRHAERIERLLYCAHRTRFRFLAELRGR